VTLLNTRHPTVEPDRVARLQLVAFRAATSFLKVHLLRLSPDNRGEDAPVRRQRRGRLHAVPARRVHAARAQRHHLHRRARVRLQHVSQSTVYFCYSRRQ
jgi:hypothetical protein